MWSYEASADTKRALARRIRAEANRLDEEIETWGSWVRTKAFWGGIIIGALIMSIMDLTDIHICVGECDFQGYDIKGDLLK